jgi:hypothetical protein
MKVDENMDYKKGCIYLVEEHYSNGEKVRLLEIKILDISPSNEFIKVKYNHNNFSQWICFEEFKNKYNFLEKLKEE